MDMIRDWVSSLFIIVLAMTFIEMLIPETSMGKYVKFIFSLIIMATIIYPVVHFAVKY